MICERTGFENGSFEDTCKLNGMSSGLKFYLTNRLTKPSMQTCITGKFLEETGCD